MRFGSKLYTKGRFVPYTVRDTEDRDNPYLYARGRYRTRIQESDLPDTFVKCNPRTCSYLQTWIQTKGVKHIHATASFLNHWAKDDYLYISYGEPIQFEADRFGEYPAAYDIAVCGGEIDRLALAIMRNSPGVDGLVQFVQTRLEKIAYLRSEHPECIPSDGYYVGIVKGYSDILASVVDRPAECHLFK